MGAVRNLILVMGDQLSRGVSSLAHGDPARDRVLMAELWNEATRVRHHKKKIAFLFSAMRHFAEELRLAGWSVDYVTLDDADNRGSFTGQVGRAVADLAPQAVMLTRPSEWVVAREVDHWRDAFGIPVILLEDDRFLCPTETFQTWARGRKTLRLEHFYRDMRRRTGLLMDGDRPVGGQWNFDAENRKPARADLFMKRPPAFTPDAVTRQVLDLVGTRFSDHFGDLEPFDFAVTAEDADRAVCAFIDHALPLFGDHQDAMLLGEPYLYHAVLSHYLNCGLLDPLDICRRAEAAFHAGHAPINAVEGFIRQIIGWREYVRGIYWLGMPDYADANFLGHHRPLPDFYWTGETDMACVKAVVGQTRALAYAHHIQRLMVTGNFGLIAGIDPHALHEWYLSVYADAFEWVEMPNTLGMSQFADGGFLASKPYAASGAYINRMSNYCETCVFDVKRRTGPGACPFNALYWDFIARHRALIGANPRMAQMVRTYDRFPPEERAAISASAEAILAGL